MPKPSEQAIETPAGEPLLAPLAKNAYRWIRDGIHAGLAAKGEPVLSFTQIDIFLNLDKEGTTIAELARRAGVARQSTHQAVGELVKAGLLRVDPDPASTRNKLVRPTQHGRARLRIAQQVLLDVENELAARIGKRKMDQLRAILHSDWGNPPFTE